MVNEHSESAQEKEPSATTTLSSAAAEETQQQSFNRPLRWFKISKFTFRLLNNYSIHQTFFHQFVVLPQQQVLVMACGRPGYNREC
jgi:hypothetical protein